MPTSHQAVGRCPILCEMNAVTIAIAHREDPLVERENTPASFAAAVGHGADMIELDFVARRDGPSSSSMTPLCPACGAWTDLWPIFELATLQPSGPEASAFRPGGGPSSDRDPLMVDFTEGEVVGRTLDASEKPTP